MGFKGNIAWNQAVFKTFSALLKKFDAFFRERNVSNVPCSCIGLNEKARHYCIISLPVSFVNALIRFANSGVVAKHGK